MPNLQIRNVPDELHRKLKARAALRGMSLSVYLLREIEAMAQCPILEELFQRIDQLGPVELSINPADLIRQERDSR